MSYSPCHHTVQCNHVSANNMQSWNWRQSVRRSCIFCLSHEPAVFVFFSGRSERERKVCLDTWAGQLSMDICSNRSLWTTMWKEHQTILCQTDIPSDPPFEGWALIFHDWPAYPLTVLKNDNLLVALFHCFQYLQATKKHSLDSANAFLQANRAPF